MVTNMQQHSPRWPKVPDHPYRILIVSSSGSAKTNALLSLIIHQQEIHLIFYYTNETIRTEIQTSQKKA